MLIVRKISVFTIRKISILTTRKFSVDNQEICMLITSKVPMLIFCNFLC